MDDTESFASRLLKSNFSRACDAAIAEAASGKARDVIKEIEKYVFSHLAGSRQAYFALTTDSPRILQLIDMEIDMNNPMAEWKQLLCRLVWLCYRTEMFDIDVCLRRLYALIGATLSEKEDGVSKETSDAIHQIAHSDGDDRVLLIVEKFEEALRANKVDDIIILAAVCNWFVIMPGRLSSQKEFVTAVSKKSAGERQADYLERKALPKKLYQTASGDMWCMLFSAASQNSTIGCAPYCEEMCKRGTEKDFFSAAISLIPEVNKAKLFGVEIPDVVTTYLRGRLAFENASMPRCFSFIHARVYNFYMTNLSVTEAFPAKLTPASYAKFISQPEKKRRRKK